MEPKPAQDVAVEGGQALLGAYHRMQASLDHAQDEALRYKTAVAGLEAQLKDKTDEVQLLVGRLQRSEQLSMVSVEQLMKEVLIEQSSPLRRINKAKTQDEIKSLIRLQYTRELADTQELHGALKQTQQFKRDNVDLQRQLNRATKEFRDRTAATKEEHAERTAFLEHQVGVLGEALSGLRGTNITGKLSAAKRSVFEIKEGLYCIRQAMQTYKRYLQHDHPIQNVQKAVISIHALLMIAEEQRNNAQYALMLLRERVGCVIREADLPDVLHQGAPSDSSIDPTTDGSPLDPLSPADPDPALALQTIMSRLGSKNDVEPLVALFQALVVATREAQARADKAERQLRDEQETTATQAATIKELKSTVSELKNTVKTLETQKPQRALSKAAASPSSSASKTSKSSSLISNNKSGISLTALMKAKQGVKRAKSRLQANKTPDGSPPQSPSKRESSASLNDGATRSDSSTPRDDGPGDASMTFVQSIGESASIQADGMADADAYPQSVRVPRPPSFKPGSLGSLRSDLHGYDAASDSQTGTSPSLSTQGGGEARDEQVADAFRYHHDKRILARCMVTWLTKQSTQRKQNMQAALRLRMEEVFSATPRGEAQLRAQSARTRRERKTDQLLETAQRVRNIPRSSPRQFANPREAQGKRLVGSSARNAITKMDLPDLDWLMAQRESLVPTLPEGHGVAVTLTTARPYSARHMVTRSAKEQAAQSLRHVELEEDSQ